MKEGIEQPKLKLNIVIAGKLPNTPKTREFLLEKIGKILSLIAGKSNKLGGKGKDYLDNSDVITFLSSPLLTDAATINEFKLMSPSAVFKCVLKGYETDIGDYCDAFDAVSNLGLTNNKFGFDNNYIFLWLSDQADLVISISENSEDCLLEQEFLNHAKWNNVVAVNIDKINPAYVFWTEKSSFDFYSDDKLKQYLNNLLQVNDTLSIDSAENASVFGHKLIWGGSYRKFMDKFKAVVDTSKPYTVDNIIDKNHKLKSVDTASEETRNTLLAWFYEFDRIANEYGEKYRSSIYLRAVIPLYVTIALSVGFYTETLLNPFPVKMAGLNLWSLIAGLGFVTHAVLNFYVFRLSEDKTIRSWHESFINNRLIAESLRMSVHFIPFGIPVNFKEIFGKYSPKIEKSNNALNKLRSINRAVGIPGVKFSKSIAEECLQAMEELVDDQRAYHEKSVKRYENICRNLKLFGKIVFYAGFIIVLLRGILQLYISLYKLPGDFNGVAIQDFVKSFTNMLALFIPAWAVYFSTKLTLCNFESLLDSHFTMVNNFSELKQKINDEKQRGYSSYASIYDLSKNVVSAILGEIGQWYSQISSKTITKL